MSEKTNDTINTVTITDGVGKKPIRVEYVEGDTVTMVLERAGITVPHGYVPTIGRVRVNNPDTDLVKPGDIIVVAGNLING